MVLVLQLTDLFIRWTIVPVPEVHDCSYSPILWREEVLGRVGKGPCEDRIANRGAGGAESIT